MLKRQAGIDIVHVPYRGTSQAMPDLVSGRVQLFFDGIPVALPLIADKKVRALATPSNKRLAMLPDVPTMAEAGYPGIELAAWFGISAPAKTPQPIVDALYAGIHKALKDPEVSKKLQELGFVIVGNTPTEFARMMHDEIEKWGAVVKASGARID